MKASARSIPAWISASVSRAVPTVNCPPESSQLWLCPASRRSWESGSSSRTETSCPAANADLATADPTRPAPTIRTNIWPLRSWAWRQRLDDGSAASVRPSSHLHRRVLGGGRRHDHPATRLAYHVLGDVPHIALERPSTATEAGAARRAASVR